MYMKYFSLWLMQNIFLKTDHWTQKIPLWKLWFIINLQVLFQLFPSQALQKFHFRVTVTLKHTCSGNKDFLQKSKEICDYFDHFELPKKVMASVSTTVRTQGPKWFILFTHYTSCITTGVVYCISCKRCTWCTLEKLRQAQMIVSPSPFVPSVKDFSFAKVRHLNSNSPNTDHISVCITSCCK